MAHRRSTWFQAGDRVVHAELGEGVVAKTLTLQDAVVRFTTGGDVTVEQGSLKRPRGPRPS